MQCGAWLMHSWPPATTIAASPARTAWNPKATVRSPEPHSWLMPKAVTPRPAIAVFPEILIG